MLILSFGSNGLPAQNIPDSLLYKLNNAHTDSIKVNALLDIGEAIETSAPFAAAGLGSNFRRCLVLLPTTDNLIEIISVNAA